MGQFAANPDSLSLEEQIKSLPDEELLDFWEETQHLVRLMQQGEQPAEEAAHPEYERLILQELQVRSCRGDLR